MAAAAPYYDAKDQARPTVMAQLSQLRAQRRGDHAGGVAYLLPSGGWALVTPKAGAAVRLRLYKGECPCSKKKG